MSYQVNDIRCPHCMAEVNQVVIKANVDAGMFAKYKHFLRQYMISIDKNNMWCPNVRCSMLIRLETDGEDLIQCK